MRRDLMLLALLGIQLPAHAVAWSALWHNADQRGDALLQAGQGKAAAQTYVDPRRRAFAAIKAGDYADAANTLAPFHDAESQYNRGNALAYLGDLKGALAAYDAALKQDPQHKDARHNRELVAKALQQQAQQSPPKPADTKPSGQQDKKQEGKQGDKTAGNGQQGQPQPGDHGKPGQNGQGKNDGHAQQADASQSQQRKPGESGKSPSSAGDTPKQANPTAPTQSKPVPANDGGQQAKPSPTRQDGAGQMASGTSGQTGSHPADDAEQARRDTAASVGQRNGPVASDGKPALQGRPTEQQLAQQQWLRAIPDDPGGLLRRKFLIEHMLRQQKGQP